MLGMRAIHGLLERLGSIQVPALRRYVGEGYTTPLDEASGAHASGPVQHQVYRPRCGARTLPGIKCWFCGKFGKRINHSHTMVCHCGSAWICAWLPGYDASVSSMMNAHTELLGGKAGNGNMVFTDIANTNYAGANTNSNYLGEYESMRAPYAGMQWNANH